jgi:hypothetical protein
MTDTTNAEKPEQWAMELMHTALAGLNVDDAALTIQEAFADLIALAHQYASDLRHPPSADSCERRLERIAAVLAKVGS